MSEAHIPGAGRGVYDFSAAAAAPAPAPASAPQLEVVDVTELNFQGFVEQSLKVPAFLLLCSRLAPQCAELRARVERIAGEYAGRLALGTVDVDAQPGIAQAFQVTAVPAMLAIIGGRPAPLFQGAPEDDQLRSVIDQVLEIAAQAGVGTAQGGAEGTQPEPEPEPLPPLHQEAYDAIERGDYTSAIAAYDKALKENPKDNDARSGRAQVSLLARTESMEPQAVRKAAADAPTDVEAQLAVADLDVSTGAVEDAFSRLIGLLREVDPEQREPIRARLVELFDVVGGADPRVVAARKALASALF